MSAKPHRRRVHPTPHKPSCRSPAYSAPHLTPLGPHTPSSCAPSPPPPATNCLRGRRPHWASLLMRNKSEAQRSQDHPNGAGPQPLKALEFWGHLSRRLPRLRKTKTGGGRPFCPIPQSAQPEATSSRKPSWVHLAAADTANLGLSQHLPPRLSLEKMLPKYRTDARQGGRLAFHSSGRSCLSLPQRPGSQNNGP